MLKHDAIQTLKQLRSSLQSAADSYRRGGLESAACGIETAICIVDARLEGLEILAGVSKDLEGSR